MTAEYRVERCSGRVWSDLYRKRVRCTNKAGDDGLCGVHRNVQRRRAEREARWQRQDEAYARERAQAAYVREWREQWPLQTYGEWWQCPLCGKVLQTEPYPPQERQSIELIADHHRRYHGADWEGYQEASGGADGD